MSPFHSMTFVLSLLVALLCWFFPLWIFRAPKSRIGNFEQRRWPEGRNLFLLFFDVARAAVGGAMALRALQSSSGLAWPEVIGLGVAAAVAFCLQSLVWSDEDYLMAPVAFALGAVVALANPWVLLLALPAAIGGAMAFRGWSGGLLAGGVVLAGAGLLVPAQDWRITGFLGMACVAPVLLSVFMGRHLGAIRR